MKSLVFLSFSILLFVACQTTKKNENTTSLPLWTTSMQDLKHELLILQPYIFNPTIFHDDDNREFLSQKIHQLSLNSKQVKHDYRLKKEDPTVNFVSVEFADELDRADKNFKGGWREYSRSQLMKVTSYCLECHARLREGPAFARNENEELFTSTLPTAERLELMIAFRQFDSAYHLALEKLAESQKDKSLNYKAERVAILGLMVAVQYLRNSKKAQQLVETIELNTSLPTYLKRKNQFWKKSIDKWSAHDHLNNLRQIRTLINSRLSEIDDMRAISALLTLLTRPLNQNELGEALLLAGQSYEELNRVSVMSLHENYYESCVRRAPRTRWAPICLSKYADSIIMGYTGTAGTRIPHDVQQRLQELRKIIKDAQR